MTAGVTIAGPRLAGRPAVRLYLLHHAGGSRAAFRGWPAMFPADWETVRVEAPGRGPGERRVTLNDFAGSVLAQMPLDGVPCAVFGHSMGALAGFALALAAEAAGESLAWLGVSAHPGPHIASQPDVQLHRLSAKALREAMVDLGGTATQALVDDKIWSWVEPMVRRDLIMAETWVPSADPAVVRVPITAYCGQEDMVGSPATVTAWASHTARFRGVRVFPGGHFYLQPARDRVAAAITADVQAALSELEDPFMTETLLFAGGYSWTETPERGITVARIEEGSVPAAVDGAATEILNPFHLLVAPSGRVLYVASNVASGTVHALAIENGKLLPLSEMPAGDGPIHLCLHPSGGYLVAVNHDSGNFQTYQLGEDGRIIAQVQEVTHVQSVPGAGDPYAQAGPHPHMSVFDPSGERMLIPDKGTDHVHVYRFDPRTGRSVPQSQVYLGAGFGPRCLAVHPSWRYLYVLGEVQSKVTTCGYDPETGALWTLDSVPTVPEGAEQGNAPAGLALSPDAGFLYAANRGHDSIAIFAVREGGARLEQAQWFRVGDPLTMFPWDLRFGSTGQVLYVANQIAGTVVTYAVAPESGTLRPAGAPLQVPGAATVALA